MPKKSFLFRDDAKRACNRCSSPLRVEERLNQNMVFKCDKCNFKLEFSKNILCGSCNLGILKFACIGRFIDYKGHGEDFFYRCDFCQKVKVYDEEIQDEYIG